MYVCMYVCLFSPVTEAKPSSRVYVLLSYHEWQKNMDREFVKRLKGRIFRSRNEEVRGRWENLCIVEFGNL